VANNGTVHGKSIFGKGYPSLYVRVNKVMNMFKRGKRVANFLFPYPVHGPVVCSCVVIFAASGTRRWFLEKGKCKGAISS
jgi:hypothetical protein